MTYKYSDCCDVLLIDTVVCPKCSKYCTPMVTDEKRKYIVGINYDSYDEDKGHYVMERHTTMAELIDEIDDIRAKGCTYPQFSKKANPTVAYAFYIKDGKEIDCTKMVNKEEE